MSLGRHPHFGGDSVHESTIACTPRRRWPRRIWVARVGGARKAKSCRSLLNQAAEATFGELLRANSCPPSLLKFRDAPFPLGRRACAGATMETAAAAACLARRAAPGAGFSARAIASHRFPFRKTLIVFQSAVEPHDTRVRTCPLTSSSREMEEGPRWPSTIVRPLGDSRV